MSESARPTRPRLHVGCGNQRLEGWVNIDRQELPGVDLVADVTRGLPFTGVEAVYAEHFLEHLPLDHALAFLLEAHRVLEPGGWLRLSTPNLDWVVATQYVEATPLSGGARAALRLNRAFHGWSHRFLWNRSLLGEVLAAVGFTELRWCRWGESEHSLLRGLERHETYVESAELPHVLIVEARKDEPRAGGLAEIRTLLQEEFLLYVRSQEWRIDPARSSVVARLRLRGPLGRRFREHVFRAAWLGGVVRFAPEAPEESYAEVNIDARHALADEPAVRGLRFLPWVPGPLQRRIDARLRGERYLDSERRPYIVFRTSSVARATGGRLAVQGELSRYDRVVPVACEVELGLDGGTCRARGEVRLRPSSLGLPRWRLGWGLVRDADELLVELDLVATPVLPT